MTNHPMLPGWPEMEPIAHARRTDPETSHEAAASVTNLTSKQAAVLEILKRGGEMCDDQIYAALWDSGYKMSDSGAETRRHELVERGLVEFTGRYVRLKSGRRSRVWQAKNQN